MSAGAKELLSVERDGVGGIRIYLDGIPVLEVQNSEVMAAAKQDPKFCHGLAQDLGFPAEAFCYPLEQDQKIGQPTALEPELEAKDLESELPDAASDGAVSEPEEPSDDGYDNDDFSP